MRRGRVAAALVALVALCAPARADILVRIDQSAQQMTVVIDGAPAHHWSISTGRDGYRTLNGSFRAIRLERVYYSKKFDDAPMPNSVFFYGGYAIHGTMEEGKLGRPASHGCVRLARVNAETLFGLVRARGMSNTRSTIPIAPRTPIVATAPREPSTNASRPISMLPPVESIWLMLNRAMVRPRYAGGECACTTVCTSALA